LQGSAKCAIESEEIVGAIDRQKEFFRTVEETGKCFDRGFPLSKLVKHIQWHPEGLLALT